MDPMQTKWARLRRRQRVSRLTPWLLPLVLLIGMVGQSGLAFFIAFMVVSAIGVTTSLYAIYTPCPACGRPFGAEDFENSLPPRWSLNPSKVCRHCGASASSLG